MALTGENPTQKISAQNVKDRCFTITRSKVAVIKLPVLSDNHASLTRDIVTTGGQLGRGFTQVTATKRGM